MYIFIYVYHIHQWPSIITILMSWRRSCGQAIERYPEDQTLSPEEGSIDAMLPSEAGKALMKFIEIWIKSASCQACIDTFPVTRWAGYCSGCCSSSYKDRKRLRVCREAYLLCSAWFCSPLPPVNQNCWCYTEDKVRTESEVEPVGFSNKFDLAWLVCFSFHNIFSCCRRCIRWTMLIRKCPGWRRTTVKPNRPIWSGTCAYWRLWEYWSAMEVFGRIEFHSKRKDIGTSLAWLCKGSRKWWCQAGHRSFDLKRPHTISTRHHSHLRAEDTLSSISLPEATEKQSQPSVTWLGYTCGCLSCPNMQNAVIPCRTEIMEVVPFESFSLCFACFCYWVTFCAFHFKVLRILWVLQFPSSAFFYLNVAYPMGSVFCLRCFSWYFFIR